MNPALVNRAARESRKHHDPVQSDICHGIQLPSKVDIGTRDGPASCMITRREALGYEENGSASICSAGPLDATGERKTDRRLSAD